MSQARLILGDCLDVLCTLEADSVDAVVTDPPAGIAFMGKDWDSFGGRHSKDSTGDQRRDSAADASRPGYGFSGASPPDRKQRARFIAFLSAAMRECLCVAKPGAVALVWSIPRTSHWTATALEDAGWQIEDRIAHLFGQGFPKHKSKLKPAVEDWWLCRKPGPKWLGVDACRIEHNGNIEKHATPSKNGLGKHGIYGAGGRGQGANSPTRYHDFGRWPANICLSHHPECNGDCHPDCPVRLLDEQAGPQKSGGTPPRRFAAKTKNAYGEFSGEENPNGIGGSAGTVSRFFYVAKASRKDRGEGNNHPTVKSTALMRWLCRLACLPSGVILDPFMGSGSTGVAAVQEGFGFIGIEKDAGYHAIAERRIAEARGPLFAEAVP